MGTINRRANCVERPITERGSLLSDFDSQVIPLMVGYMKTFLEKLYPVFGDLLICLFARKARLEARILYKVDRFWELLQILLQMLR
jgi:hypothetical protein